MRLQVTCERGTSAHLSLRCSQAAGSTVCRAARTGNSCRSQQLQLHALPAREGASVEESEDEETEDFRDGRRALRASTSYEASPGDDEARDFALAMAQVAWETKADDVVVLHVAPLVYWTRYMVIATVFSRPQLNAVLAKMTKEARDVHGRELGHNVPGKTAWELLDYGDSVVHVLTAEQRDFYDLESLYGAAEEVALPFAQGPGAQGAAAWQTRM